MSSLTPSDLHEHGADTTVKDLLNHAPADNMDSAFKTSAGPAGELQERGSSDTAAVDETPPYLPFDILAKSLGMEAPLSYRRVCKQLRSFSDDSRTQLRIQDQGYISPGSSSAGHNSAGKAFQHADLLCLLRRLPRLDTLLDLDPYRSPALPWEEMGQILGGQLTRLAFHCRWQVGPLTFLTQFSSLHTLEGLCGEDPQPPPLELTLPGPQSAWSALRHLSVPGLLALLQPLSALRGLQHLVVRGLPVMDLRSLTGCSQLQCLELRKCLVKDLGPLGGCSQLQSLDLGGCFVISLGALARCTELRTLKLSHIDNLPDLGPLASCRKLQHLDISLNVISNLEPLGGLQELRHLDMRGTRTWLGYELPSLGPLARIRDLRLLN